MLILYDIDLVNSIHNASGLSWEKTYEILRDSIGYDGLIEENFLNKGETIYDLFRNRIMFPIHNSNGEAVGFSGRIYENVAE